MATDPQPVNDVARRRWRLVGIIMIVCAPIVWSITGVYAFTIPILFEAHATLKLNFPSEDGPRMEAALAWAKQRVLEQVGKPEGLNEAFTNAYVVQTSAAEQYRLTAVHGVGQTAADGANLLSIQIRDYLTAKFREAAPDATKKAAEGTDANAPAPEEQKGQFRIEVVEKATVPKEPSREKFDEAMKLGFSLGALLGVGGVGLILSNKSPTGPKPAHAPAPAEPLAVVREERKVEEKNIVRRRKKNRYNY